MKAFYGIMNVLLGHLAGVHCSNRVDCPEMIDEMRPQDVDFHSTNYNNILHWIPGCQWEEDTIYFVQYKIYGDKRWTNKVECWGIKNTFCDLSQETAQSSEWYYARVRAAISRRKSGWAVSPRFIPAFTTVVTAPKIKLESTKSSLLIRVRPPHSPHRRRNGTWISMQKLRNLKHRVYILDNKLPDESEKKVYEGCARIILVAKLTSKTFYCVVVETIDVTSGWTSPRSEKRCIRTL
ncbi:interleukin-22 receptor subunit alpha-2-like [Polypterus senegalus]|uniref:interleukin-22 receptor subunit alpha-2-like n=1 Tax=Polypterus senegalus TaxID=55291 RepID=UPI001965F6B1|nr:interleukin-22 receptor subunit alpha-2-like [Polypterus senegalus]